MCTCTCLYLRTHALYAWSNPRVKGQFFQTGNHRMVLHFLPFFFGFLLALWAGKGYCDISVLLVHISLG